MCGMSKGPVTKPGVPESGLMPNSISLARLRANVSRAGGDGGGGDPRAVSPGSSRRFCIAQWLPRPSRPARRKMRVD